MSKTLTEIAQALHNDKKVQLIYAFNGVGKTRLSREFKGLIAPDATEEEEEQKAKILYYNAFTEDLFYWDNDLDADADRKLKIQPNEFTTWILRDQGQDANVTTHFQRYTNPFVTPRFSEDFSEVTFSLRRGDDESINNIKISKGEESCFIWCVFYSLLKEAIEVRNVAEPDDRSTDVFNELEYIFIDDPVSSLDDTHLIELAVDIAERIKKSDPNLKFIITTHNPLFYNVLFNELKIKKAQKYILIKLEDGTYKLSIQEKDSPFAYHLFLLSELEKAIQSNTIQKYHFNFLRNLLEKTATFLGYEDWQDLLPQDSREGYYKRIINFSSHSKHNGEEPAELKETDKLVLGNLVDKIKRTYHFQSNINTSADGSDPI